MPIAPLSSTGIAQDLLLRSGLFDEHYYARQSGLRPDADLLRHYLEIGWRWGLQPSTDFDGTFLHPFYAAAGLSGPPLLEWAELAALGHAPPRTQEDAQRRAAAIRGSGMLDAEWYGGRLTTALDPAVHYVVCGEALGWRPSRRFDPVFYVECYPDIASAGMSPLMHFLDFGQRESRRPQAVADELAYPVIGSQQDRVVLVLVHEASRTGAPLLALNLVEDLAKRHKVVSVILRPGPLVQDFRDRSDGVVGPMDWLHMNSVDMRRLAERLAGAYRPLYAVANSLETAQLIPGLAMWGVPSIALIHEFAAYYKLNTKLNEVVDWAPEVVFPARTVADSSLKACPRLNRRPGLHIFPQGRVEPPAQRTRLRDNPGNGLGEQTWDAVAASRQVRPDDARNAFIVLGAGTVDLRKGVDLFIATAFSCRRQAPDLDLRFVWIGAGYDPVEDMLYSTYLAEQIERSNVGHMMKIIKPVTDLEPIYAASNAFFMSSRLDPQPNVGIDALSRGLPVVCFAGGSGTAELLLEDAATRDLVAPYLDPAAAASIICELARDPARYAARGEAVQKLAQRTFERSVYVDRIDAFGRQAEARLRPEDLSTLQETDLDPDLVMPPLEIVPGVVGLAHIVRQQWATIGMSKGQTHNNWFRRGFAGFHPQIYASHHSEACIDGGETPLAHWLRGGRPPGPWARRLLDPVPVRTACNIRVALHAHFFYPDLLSDLLYRLDWNGTRCDLFLTTDTERKAEELRSLCASRGRTTIKVLPNRGRDIAPFLEVLRDVEALDYDLIGHVHGKKSQSVDPTVGDRWRDFLWTNLVGPEPMLDSIALATSSLPSFGLVMAEDPHLVGWDDNQAHALQLATRMGLPDALPDYLDFPLGTMFWARPKALAPLLSLKLTAGDFPEEPLPDDGTVLHAIERLIPMVVQHAGFEVMSIRLPGTNW